MILIKRTRTFLSFFAFFGVLLFGASTLFTATGCESRYEADKEIADDDDIDALGNEIQEELDNKDLN